MSILRRTELWYGIELLDANAQLASGDKGRIVSISETLAKTFEIPLAG